jgi:hypothetical protein
MNNIKYLLILSIFAVFLFAKQENFTVQEEIVISSNDGGRPVVIQNNSSDIAPQNREEIDLWVDDFETDLGWSLGSGWEWSTADYNSTTHSMHSGGTASNGSFDLVSPEIQLPALGEGETMAFGFYLFADLPDSDGDGDGYLEDYYTVSIQDTDALAWHPSETDSYDGSSWWCADESVGSNGGYLDSWIQFMDTPSFTVPSGATLSADLMWSIESDAGASVAGTCTDGWDAANVQISVDGGENWELLNGSDPYDFQCGYGWIWNSPEYDTGGSLNHLAAGWGNTADWHNVTFDLSQYIGQEATIRFAFGSDPAYCTLDDASITGFHVDNVMVSGALDCTPENNCETSVSGAVWVDQFYDYGGDPDYDQRPGSDGWTEYLPGYPFNGNVFLDISDFSEKNVVFRVQSRFDDNDDAGAGTGLWIDDFRIYKISGGNYPAPWDLMGEGLGGEAALTWADMNASGTEDFQFDSDSFDPNNGIVLNGDGSAWAAERFDLAGTSTVNQVSIHSINDAAVEVEMGAFGQVGTLFDINPMYSQTVTLQPGWNDFTVSWEMNNSFLIGYTFSADVTAGLDGSEGGNSMVMLGGGWDDWSETAAANALPTGEWGVRANISFDGAGVTYNVYRDGAPIVSGLTDNSYSDMGLTNNTTYVYAVSATYSDGEESGLSESVEVTPQAQTVHEEYHDDGTAESGFNAGSGNFTAVKYSADNAGESVVRFKWYQMEDGGAFYLKMYQDDNGMPGDEFYSSVIAGGVVTGWNTKDLSDEGIFVSGDFWIGTKEFSSTSPFGLDTDSMDMGMSYTRVGTTGEWTSVAGNLMERIYLDCGENCDEGGSCTAGDVNGDGVINVLDIVSTVSFVMGTQSPSDEEACAADYNGDGTINVLDIVSIVGVITGG